MIYRRFGKTELQMPVISTGLMRSMHQWLDLPIADIPEESQRRQEAVLKRSLELGINHFETARGYGSSERQLGAVLTSAERKKSIIQTKILPTRDPQDFTKHFLQSLERLQLDSVDLLAIHGINDHRSFWYTCRENGCLAAARRLQDKGKIGHIGFSGHGSPEIILEAVRHRRDGGFDYLNVHWYYIYQINWPAIHEAHERDLGVYIISPTDKGGRLQSPPAKMMELCKPLTPMQFNDLFCLCRPEIASISLGASTPGDYDEHLLAIGLLADADSLTQKIDNRLQKAMRTATDMNRPDAFFETLPSYEWTPGYINLPFILWLYNLGRGWDLIDFVRGRYSQMGYDMPWVPGNHGATLENFDFTEAFEEYEANVDEIISLAGQAHDFLSTPPGEKISG